MIIGIGIDLCEVKRMESALEGSFLTRYFTEGEQAYIRSRGKAAAQSLAGHFAAKEAALKAIGCGIVLPLTDVEVVHNGRGAPGFVLHGKALESMHAAGGTRMHLSITHTADNAAAVAIMESEPEGGPKACTE